MVIITLYDQPKVNNVLIETKEFINNLINKLELKNIVVIENRFDCRNLINKKSKNYITPSLSKSERFEVFCKSKTLNKTYIILYFNEIDETDLESPNINKNKQDRNSIKYESEDDIELIKEIIDQKNIKANYATKIRVDNSEYLNKFCKIIEGIKNEYKTKYENYKNIKNILNEIENSLYQKANVTKIDINKLDKVYRELIDDELKHKGVL